MMNQQQNDTPVDQEAVSTTDYQRAPDGLWKSDEDNEDNDTPAKPNIVLLLDVYKTKQQYGYCSILFSILQTTILFVMMWQCGIAPLYINPMIGPPPDALSYWGAKNSALILENGESYRLLTPLFLHAGILHLVGNIGVQLETGVFFEREWGSVVWTIIYLASAVGSSILSVVLIPSALSVGSSGAVMGLFGAKLAEIFCRACESRTSIQEKAGHEMRKHQLVLCVGGVVLVMAFSFIPFVDWAAHLGGLLAGMTVGLTIFAFSIQNWAWRIIWFLVGLSTTIIGFVMSLKYMYTKVEPLEILRDVCAYYQEYYQDYECSCTRGD